MPAAGIHERTHGQSAGSAVNGMIRTGLGLVQVGQFGAPMAVRRVVAEDAPPLAAAHLEAPSRHTGAATAPGSAGQGKAASAASTEAAEVFNAVIRV